ncbi:MAG TPA: hypothetical protein VGJ93_15010 [Desulfuromonadaceae bacterium]
MPSHRLYDARQCGHAIQLPAAVIGNLNSRRSVPGLGLEGNFFIISFFKMLLIKPIHLP